MSLGSFSRDDNDRQRRARDTSNPANNVRQGFWNRTSRMSSADRVRPTGLPNTGGRTSDRIDERREASRRAGQERYQREQTRNQQLARVNRPGSPGGYQTEDLQEARLREERRGALRQMSPGAAVRSGLDSRAEEARPEPTGNPHREGSAGAAVWEGMVDRTPEPSPRAQLSPEEVFRAENSAIPRDMARGPGERTRSLTTREPEFREMTWEEYDALDPRTRAAVDANTLLREALDRDASVIEQFDRDGDGRLSMSEAAYDLHGEDRDPLALGNYANNYTGVFGRFQAAEDDPSNWNRSMSYAPNTLAALNFMGLQDDEGGLDDYLSGAAFVTDDDILRNRHRTEGGTGREAMISNLSLNMESLNTTLAEGRMMIDNARQSTSFATADVSGLVESLSTGMLGGANLQAAGLPDADIGENILPNLAALSNPAALQLDNTFNQMLAGMEAVAASYNMPVEELLTDQTFVEETMWSEFNVDATYEDWVAYLERVSQQRSAQANAAPAEGADEDTYQPAGS